ncbi:MAG: PhzF family phenazine biosynthesis protein [Anaerolineae bacterium]
MRRAPFVQADVFSDSPFGGNPVVVITDASDMTTTDMLAVAQGMNFAETGFVLPATTTEADWRLRAFTPATEVPFSGHLILGAAYVLMTKGDTPPRRVVVETDVGYLPVDADIDDGGVSRVVVTERTPHFGKVITEIDDLAAALGLAADRIGTDGLPPQIVDAGLPTLIVPTPSRDDVGRVAPAGLARLYERLGASVINVFTRETLKPEHSAYVRVFAPLLGVPEDPATGSANAALAAYLVRHGAFPATPRARISAEQGYAVGRPSLIVVDVLARGEDLELRVGGRVARAAEGVIYY